MTFGPRTYDVLVVFEDEDKEDVVLPVLARTIRAAEEIAHEIASESGKVSWVTADLREFEP